ncbi:hypothetical protein SLOPH_486 [Spraguea lophii 42_110]|uniref:Uncharacterized protein n=1 Tax=Spraguea lophii (strain 42_110) TaxID=1358809 RepID=S7W974_SPRLO|nr:hypothetical protein SLOPH_486 [Spraguea lophii 42_110]
MTFYDSTNYKNILSYTFNYTHTEQSSVLDIAYSRCGELLLYSTKTHIKILSSTTADLLNSINTTAHNICTLHKNCILYNTSTDLKYLSYYDNTIIRKFNIKNITSIDTANSYFNYNNIKKDIQTNTTHNNYLTDIFIASTNTNIFLSDLRSKDFISNTKINNSKVKMLENNNIVISTPNIINIIDSRYYDRPLYKYNIKNTKYLTSRRNKILAVNDNYNILDLDNKDNNSIVAVGDKINIDTYDVTAVELSSDGNYVLSSKYSKVEMLNLIERKVEKDIKVTKNTNNIKFNPVYEQFVTSTPSINFYQY